MNFFLMQLGMMSIQSLFFESPKHMSQFMSQNKLVLIENGYGKCSNISNTFLSLFSNELSNNGYQGWSSQNACQS